MLDFDKLPKARYDALMAQAAAQVHAVVVSGKCPLCGAVILEAPGIVAWFQCANVPTSKNKPSAPCSWAEFDN